MAGKEPLEVAAICERAGRVLEDIEGEAPFPRRLRRIGLTETWFSDQLAWLLDPGGTHGLGARFAEELLKIIARRRTYSDREGNDYKRRGSFLKWHRSGAHGTRATGFRLRNAAVFREFYLARGTGGRRNGSAMLCDIVFLDLDTHDGLFLAIENKLFTTNHRGQLERYYELVETRYRRAKVREYVYLTLLGDRPETRGSPDPRICERMWVRMSWVEDVLGVLEKLRPARDPDDPVGELVAILRWMAAACDARRREEVATAVATLFEALARAGTDIVVDELVRLNEGGRGSWSVKRRGRSRTRILHSSKPTAPLFVGILPNLSIVLYSDKRDRNRYDKLLIPFGSNPDQIHNLADIVSRDVYELHFGSSRKAYLGGKRRLRTTTRSVRDESRALLTFIHQHRHAIQALVPLARLQARHVLPDMEEEPSG